MQTKPMTSLQDDIEERLFERQKNIIFRITSALKAKGWTRKNLADKMKIHESSLSRMLTTDSNLTLKTVVQIEIATGDDLLLTPQEFEFRFIDNKEYRKQLIYRADSYDEKKQSRHNFIGTMMGEQSERTIVRPIPLQEMVPYIQSQLPNIEGKFKPVSANSLHLSISNFSLSVNTDYPEASSSWKNLPYPNQFGVKEFKHNRSQQW
jgi:transcriptional regulator with XRE-family HTH domain